MRLLKLNIFYSVLLTLFVVGCRQQQNGMISLPASDTNIDFKNITLKEKAFGILYYLYYYNGGGVATGDINNDGLPDIYFTANNKGGNKLYLNKGNFKFEDITASAGVAGSSDWSSGVTMADVNGDGLLDIYVSAVNIQGKLKSRNQLFINHGGGKFTDEAQAYGLDFSGFSTQAVFFDYDHDGDLDCYLLNQSHKANENITDTINRRKFDPEAGDKFFRNELNTGAKKFTDVSAAAGIYQSSLGYGLGIAVADLNNDGWDDIYVGNDFHENDYYYINNGDGSFTESGAKHFRHYSRFSMGNDIADYNNDGNLDVITVDMLPGNEAKLKTYGSDENADTYRVKLTQNGYQNQYSRNCLQLNNGNGESFSDVALMNGVSATDWSWSALFADWDNDGVKDLFISSGIRKRPVDLDYIRFVSDLYTRQKLNQTDKFDDQALDKMPDGASHPFFYQGNLDSGFHDVSEAWGTGAMNGYYNGAAYADLDNDGRLDMVINCLDAPATILKNNQPAKHWLSLQFRGAPQNTAGIGAKAYLFTGATKQFQELMLTRGFQSSSEARLHFGLNEQRIIDSILVVWPDQRYQVLRQVSADTLLTVQYALAQTDFDYHSFFPAVSPALTDVSATIGFSWKHIENPFNDFNAQYLIPHEQSTRGPKIAVADVNNDGLDDFYACGSAMHSGMLMVQQKNGKFTQADSTMFSKDIFTDQTGAVFFDADNDGFKDLLVISGGNERSDGDAALADRLYLNDHNGHFHFSPLALPIIAKNKSCVTVADVDKDGDQDVFIGGLAEAKRYGYPQSSYLLLNDGHGKFTLAPGGVINLQNIGITTAAVFTDLDNDGWVDLVVSGEWMPVKIFMNRKGKFELHDVAQSTGLWQSVYAADVNGDGYTDLLAGNWGHNCKLYSGKSGPLKLYVKDFDKNGSVEQIMTYTIDGKEYPFLAKDELERALPVLKKAYLTYGEVAGKTVQYMFYDLFKDYLELKAETLSSSCFINDGEGNFTRHDLPTGLQVAPIFAFNKMGGRFIAAGNFYGVVPYEGRYDALQPTIFSFENGKNNATSKVNAVLSSVSGEFRDAEWLTIAGKQPVLALTRNNDSVLFLKQGN